MLSGWPRHVNGGRKPADPVRAKAGWRLGDKAGRLRPVCSGFTDRCIPRLLRSEPVEAERAGWL